MVKKSNTEMRTMGLPTPPVRRTTMLFSCLVLVLLVAQVPSVAAHHQSWDEDPESYSYYVGGSVSTNGGGAMPDIQWSLFVCQQAAYENVLHEPIGIGGACKLPLESGLNRILVVDETNFGLESGTHQEGFWYRCHYIDDDGALQEDETWYYSDLIVDGSIGYQRYYADVEGGQDCLMVDVTVPITASFGEIKVMQGCFDIDCVWGTGPGYWEYIQDVLRPVTGPVNEVKSWAEGNVEHLIDQVFGDCKSKECLQEKSPRILESLPDPCDFRDLDILCNDGH